MSAETPCGLARGVKLPPRPRGLSWPSAATSARPLRRSTPHPLVAQGVTKAIAQGGIFGLVTGGIVAAAGAIQIATIRIELPSVLKEIKNTSNLFGTTLGQKRDKSLDLRFKNRKDLSQYIILK